LLKFIIILLDKEITYPKSIINKHKLKKENHSNSFILRPIEDHPLLSEKTLSQSDINKLLQQYQNQLTNSKSSNSVIEGSNPDNFQPQDSNNNISMIVPNQNFNSFTNSNQQFEIAIPEAQTVAIELKPKWGFKPNPKTSHFSNPESLVKYDYCRYCLHYLLKNKGKIEVTHPLNSSEVHPILKNHFCPLDLYSGDDSRTRKAINSLYNHPGNNLKLFINGKQINLKDLSKNDNKKEKLNNEEIKNTDKENKKEDKKEKKDKENSEFLIKNLTEFFHCDKEMIKPVFCDFLTHIVLQESELFQRLKFHQRHLDSLDIEKIIKFYDYFIKNDYKLGK